MATTRFPEPKIRNLAALFACVLTLFATVPLSAPARAQTPPNMLEQFEDALTALVHKAQPCVVTIQPHTPALALPATPELLSHPRASLPREKQGEYDAALLRFIRDTIDALVDYRKAQQALFKTAFTGSGFVIRGGFVVTTAEVAERVKNPAILFADGRRLEIEWVHADALSNIALMKIPAPSDFGMEWADSGAVEPGAVAVAIGSQGEFSRSVSLGIVSGTGRAGRSGPLRYENLIQFQGAVGAGGSGGPLLNARGELIGMVVAAPADVFAPGPRPHSDGKGRSGERHDAYFPPSPLTPFSGLSNTGFALASNDIRPLVEILRFHEKRPPSGYIGIFLSSDMESPLAQIIDVLPNSPAAKAGLLNGDIITAINGQTFRTAAQLRAFAGRLAAGDDLQVTFRRGSDTKTAHLIALPRPGKQ